MEDFLKVIDTKVSHWLNDEKWAMYLRPGTLFGTKFDKYINEDVRDLEQQADVDVWYE